MLRVLVTAKGLSQAKLPREVGIAQSTLSAVMKGTRSLTREQVTTLAKYFHVSPMAFLKA